MSPIFLRYISIINLKKLQFNFSSCIHIVFNSFSIFFRAYRFFRHFLTSLFFSYLPRRIFHRLEAIRNPETYIQYQYLSSYFRLDDTTYLLSLSLPPLFDGRRLILQFNWQVEKTNKLRGMDENKEKKKWKKKKGKGDMGTTTRFSYSINSRKICIRAASCASDKNEMEIKI